MNSDSEENEEVEVEVQEKPVKAEQHGKPKKVLSEAQLEVLKNARIAAAARKKAMRAEKDEQLKQIKTKYKSKEKKKIDGDLIEEKPIKQQIEEKELKEKELPKKIEIDTIIKGVGQGVS